MGVSCGQARQHLLSAKGREERQLQLPFVHGGPRRTATATPFVHGGPRKNGNGNTFCPRRAAKGRGERQRQHLLSTGEGREGPRRTATATPFVTRRAAKGRDRTATATSFCPRRATKDHEERQLQLAFCPRRAAKGTHEGATAPFVHETKRSRRTATATPFVHGGPLGAAENFLLIHGVRGVSGEESGVRGRSGRLSQGAQGLWRGRCAFWWLDDL